VEAQDYQDSADISFDAASMVSSYVGKSKLSRAKSQIHTKRYSGRSGKRLTPAPNTLDSTKKEQTEIKVFIPKDYFKHAGYIRPETADSVSEQRQ